MAIYGCKNKGLLGFLAAGGIRHPLEHHTSAHKMRAKLRYFSDIRKLLPFIHRKIANV